MPKPEVNQSGTVRVGKFDFTPTHTLSRIGLLPKLLSKLGFE